MLIDYQLTQTGVVVRVKLRNSSVATGAGLAGLTNASTGLVIAAAADNEATTTAYTAAGSTIDTIATLGTFAAPTATHCRFREYDATNHKGIYELQFENSRFAVASSKSLLISISGAANLAECDVCIPLRGVNPYDAVRGGMTALPNATAAAAGGLPTVGTGSGQVNPDGTGAVPVAFGTALPTASTVVAASVGEALFYADMVGGRRNTAQGGTATTITLDAGASSVDNTYKDHAAKLIGGTGSGQYATIIGYVGATKVATIWRPGTGNGWATTPDNTTQFVTIPCPVVDVSGFLGAAATFDGNGYLNVNARDYGGTTVTGGLPNTVAPLTAAQVGTAVWTDTVGSDFTVTNSAGIGLAGLVTAVAGKLDAAVSGVPAAVWRDATAGDFAVTSSAGLKLMGLTGGTDPWATALPGAYGAGTAGNIVGTNLNATVSSRLATAGYTAPPTTAQVATAVWTDLTSGSDFATVGSAGKLLGDNLNATITSRMATFVYTAPPTAAAIAAAVLTDTTDTATAGSLGHLIGTAPSWYAAPPTPPTAAQNAAAVWQDTTAGDFTVGGSAGAKLVALAAGVTVTTNNDKAGYGLAATGLDAIGIETGINMAQAQSLILAACAGIVSGAGTGTITIKGAGGTTTRILATVDSLGDRSALTLTPPSI